KGVVLVARVPGHSHSTLPHSALTVQGSQSPLRSANPCHPVPDRRMLEGRDGPGGRMFGAIVGAMLIVYAVLAVAMVIMLPLTIIARMRRELAGEVPILDELEGDLARSRAEDLEEKR